MLARVSSLQLKSKTVPWTKVILIGLLFAFSGTPGFTRQADISPAVSRDIEQWRGGVVAHHSLIYEEIEQFWQTVSDRYASRDSKPDVIFLVGPDHQNRGSQPVTTTDHALVKALALPFVGEDSALRADHSIQLHLPLLAQWLPNVPVRPLLIRSDATKQQMLALAQRVQTVFGQTQHVLVIASVDFSHYLSPAEAERNDRASLQAMQQFDYDTLQWYNADHMDSDQAIIFLSEVVCPTRDCLYEVLYHGNANDYIPAATSTTSYFHLLLEPD